MIIDTLSLTGVFGQHTDVKQMFFFKTFNMRRLLLLASLTNRTTENRPKAKRKVVSQPPIFKGKLLVSGSVQYVLPGRVAGGGVVRPWYNLRRPKQGPKDHSYWTLLR